jgi:hypothetical protein
VWRLMFLSISLGTGLFFAPSTKAVRRGDALYRGKEKLTGKIRGHDDAMPPEAVRCINCHEADNRSRLLGTAAPHIDRELMLDVRQRRGGPPSRYDEPKFCKLLRTGADPSYVLIAREMPVYEVDDDQCASLWAFLVERPRVNAKQ